MVLQSTAPALQNPMLQKTLDEIGGKEASGSRRTDKTDKVVAETKLYRHGGKMGWPALNLGAALCEAGKHVQAKLGAAKKTSAITKSTGRGPIPTIVGFTKSFYPFTGVDAETGEIEWEPNGARTVNPQTGGSNRTVRPLLNRWEMEVEFTYTGEFSDDTMLELWQKAGEKAGLGDGRPSAPNKPLPIPHGTFKVVSFKITKREQVDDSVKIEFAPDFREAAARGNGDIKPTVELASVTPRPEMVVTS